MICTYWPRSWGMPEGVSHARVLGIAETLRLLDARFDLANARQILIQLVPIVTGQPPIHPSRFFQHEVQDGPLLLLPALHVRRAFTGRACAKQAFKDQARIGFGSDGRCR